MSWNISVRKPTKGEAKQAVADDPAMAAREMRRVVTGMEQMVNALPEPQDQDVAIVTSGHIDPLDKDQPNKKRTGQITVSVLLVERGAP